MNDTHFED